MDAVSYLKEFAGELLGLNLDPASRENVLRYAHERLLQAADVVASELQEMEVEDGQDAITA